MDEEARLHGAERGSERHSEARPVPSCPDHGQDEHPSGRGGRIGRLECQALRHYARDLGTPAITGREGDR
jgi:hypothetical protein